MAELVDKKPVPRAGCLQNKNISKSELFGFWPVIVEEKLVLPATSSTFARFLVNHPAGIAQLVEQATENRRVPSSNLGPGIASLHKSRSSPAKERFFAVEISARHGD
jgi:hypothetical protein